MSQAHEDDRAAIRAFLQRSEVRLSTLHRVAGAFLSGAGLLVVLPLLAKDSFVAPVNTMLTALIADFDVPTALLLGVFVTTLALPLLSLYLLFKDIALFYFTGHELGTADPEERHVFYPRFILSGLKMPSDDLVATSLQQARDDERLLRIVMPASAVARGRIDGQAEAYLQERPQPGPRGDGARRDLLMQFSASVDSRLVEEVVKMEFSLARHILRLRLMVLRYIKAVLALVTTAAAIFAAGSVLGHTMQADKKLQWMAGILMIWSVLAAAAVSLPTRWVFAFTASDDQRNQRNYRDDRELLYFEDRALWLTTASFWAALAAEIALVSRGGDLGSGDLVLIVLALLVAGAQLLVIRATGGWRHFLHVPAGIAGR